MASSVVSGIRHCSACRRVASEVGTPTTFMLEERIATLEGGKHCVLVPSGLAAISNVDMALLSAGDEVLLFGDGSHGEPTAQEWAEALGTIDYEIVTRIGARVPRAYTGRPR